MNDEQIKYMVDRFLGWRLPENFRPDAGISFKPTFNDHMPFGPQKHNPIGTNLFDREQAEAMMRYLIDSLPAEERIDALAAENERLRKRVESMQHVVNCASIFAGLSDMDEIDGEEEHEAMMRLLEAVDGYRAALAKEPTT